MSQFLVVAVPLCGIAVHGLGDNVTDAQAQRLADDIRPEVTAAGGAVWVATAREVTAYLQPVIAMKTNDELPWANFGSLPEREGD